MERTYYFTAGTTAEDGDLQRHTGTLEGAIERAQTYALRAAGRDENGVGPQVVVVDAETGRRVYEERL